MENPKFKISVGVSLYLKENKVFNTMTFKVSIPSTFGPGWVLGHIIEPIEKAIRNEIKGLSKKLNIEFVDEDGIEN